MLDALIGRSELGDCRFRLQGGRHTGAAVCESLQRVIIVLSHYLDMVPRIIIDNFYLQQLAFDLQQRALVFSLAVELRTSRFPACSAAPPSPRAHVTTI